MRFGYVLMDTPGPYGDSFFYRGAAEQLAEGNGYIDPFTVLIKLPQPTAQHPPLFPIYLAVWTKLGAGENFQIYQIACCLLGALTVLLIGLLGRHVGGPTVGLLAAGIAAVYPPLAMIDSTVNSESLYVLLIVLTLLAAFRFADAPTLGRAAVVGLGVGLVTLTRSDGIFLLVLLVVPLVWRFGRRRLLALGACLAAVALLVGPWVLRNWSVFDRFPLLSTNSGYTLAATNCEPTYYTAQDIGFVNHECVRLTHCNSLKLEELPLSDCRARKGRAYVTDHLGRLPLVLLARIGRVWEVYHPNQNLDYGQHLWARPRGMARVGLFMYAALVPFALVGAVLLKRRRKPLLPLLAMFVLASLVAASAFGFTRFRLAAEPALVVLAAVGIEGLAVSGIRRIRRRPNPTSGTSTSDRAVSVHGGVS